MIENNAHSRRNLKTMCLALLLGMHRRHLWSGDPVLLVDVSATAQASESTEPASSQGTRINPIKEAGIRKLLKLQGITDGLNRILSELSESISPKIPAKLPPGKYRERLVNLFSFPVEAKVA